MQGIQCPGNAIAHLGLGLFEVAHPGFRTLQVGAQSVPLAFQGRKPSLQRIGRARLLVLPRCASSRAGAIFVLAF